ncbi:MAG: CYTH domain-containing protein [Prevotella sp.]|jgi:adenylate cyclase|nr:CYTH domain-containing protein [Prevotella sp.]
MTLEIERKFLVRGDFKQYAHACEKIVQGYLSSVPERVVRVRIKGDKAYITVKGAGDESGMCRYEWEKEIPAEEARELIKLCEPGIVDKVRYYIKNGIRKFEVDEFNGENEGLVIAEIELADREEAFDRPDWLGEEVTGNKRYYNSSLVKYPYKDWSK